MPNMEHYPVRPAILLILFTILSSPTTADGLSSAIRVDPTAEARRLAAAKEPLDLEIFIRAASVFSGTPEDELATVEGKITALIDELKQELVAVPDPRQRAEATLAFMHGKILRRYDEKQTRLDVLLARGSYNCVSSGVLYATLIKALNLRVWGIRTADHSF